MSENFIRPLIVVKDGVWYRRRHFVLTRVSASIGVVELQHSCMKTVGFKTIGLQKELRSKPIPVDQKLEVKWNDEEVYVDEKAGISRIVGEAYSGMVPDEERVRFFFFFQKNVEK